jgi:DNA polymerase III delta subunit
MVEPRIFLFLGTDEDQKQNRIDSLQKKFFPPELKDLNYTLLYADEKQLTLAAIDDVLFCLPTSGAKKRLLVIKMAHKLSRSQSAGLIEKLKKPSDTVVVLDIPQAKGTESLVDGFKKLGANIVRFKDEEAASAFDLGRAIMSRHPESALKILSVLLRYRDKAEKILGAVFWQWERSYGDRRLSDDAYGKGLKLILDADKRLKSSSSGLARQTLILEALVVKLSYLA